LELDHLCGMIKSVGFHLFRRGGHFRVFGHDGNIMSDVVYGALIGSLPDGLGKMPTVILTVEYQFPARASDTNLDDVFFLHREGHLNGVFQVRLVRARLPVVKISNGSKDHDYEKDDSSAFFHGSLAAPPPQEYPREQDHPRQHKHAKPVK